MCLGVCISSVFLQSLPLGSLEPVSLAFESLELHPSSPGPSLRLPSFFVPLSQDFLHTRVSLAFLLKGHVVVSVDLGESGGPPSLGIYFRLLCVFIVCAIQEMLNKAQGSGCRPLAEAFIQPLQRLRVCVCVCFLCLSI